MRLLNGVNTHTYTLNTHTHHQFDTSQKKDQTKHHYTAPGNDSIISKPLSSRSYKTTQSVSKAKYARASELAQLFKSTGYSHKGSEFGSQNPVVAYNH